MRTLRKLGKLRRLGLPAAALLAAICIVPGIAMAGSGPGARTHDFDVGGTHGSGAAQSRAAVTRNQQFTTTANPLSLDPPVPVPPTTPTQVTIISNQPFPDAHGQLAAQRTVALPAGHWAEVVLHVDGQESGRQYDRLLDIYDGSSPLFIGVTPEPTPAGIAWSVTKDVSDYLPILSGPRVFTVTLANYLSSIDTGIPSVSVSLWFYPGHGEATDIATPDSVVAIGTPGATSPVVVRASRPLQAQVTLPNDLTNVRLQLYAIAQSNEEFWWSLEPAFREVEISVDGKPAGVVWPFPSIYTGGVNPLLWRPITAIGTLDLPVYDVDLSPFAGLLGGQHTITINVTNNSGYWLIGGSLLFNENGGHPTTGSLLTDTLTFPTTASNDYNDNALGSSANQVIGQSATLGYEIQGSVTDGHKTWTDDLTSSLQFSNDQTNVTTNYMQFVHGEQIASTTEVSRGPDGPALTQKETDVYTVDAPNAFLQSPDGSDFFLPAQVTQSLDVTKSVRRGDAPAAQSHLYENVQGYAALEEDNAQPTIAVGSTTGYVTYTAANGGEYQRLVVARGGVILHDTVTNTLRWQR